MYLLGIFLKLFCIIFPYFFKAKYFFILLAIYSVGCMIFYTPTNPVFWFDSIDLMFFIVIYSIVYFPVHYIIKAIFKNYFNNSTYNSYSRNNHNYEDNYSGPTFEQQSLLDRHSEQMHNGYNNGYQSNYYDSEGQIDYDKVAQEVQDMEDFSAHISSSNE